MATDKQIAADRRNAQKSTGPKTLVGRANSSRNPLRHDLTKPLTEDLSILTEAYQLAKAITVDESGLQSNDAALEIALAHLAIRRIRAARNLALSEVMATLSAGNDPRAVQHISGFDRYERLARQRQRRAIRKLERVGHDFDRRT